VWKMPLGLNDCLATRPGKKPLLVRRDVVDNPKNEFRARELGPNEGLSDLYTVPGGGDVHSGLLSAGGRLLFVKSTHGAKLYDGETGTPVPIEPARAGGSDFGWLSPNGKVLTIHEAGNEENTVVLGLADRKPLGVQHRGILSRTDESGRLGISSQVDHPSDDGVALYRIGEARPLVTFDRRRPPITNCYDISPDGRFILWGRWDGTVCVADVNMCMEQLAKFGKR